MKAIVIGYGSIGSRHTRILKELGCEISVVSRHETGFRPCYRNVTQAVRAEKPQYAIVATGTREHIQSLGELRRAGFSGTVLVEKPLCTASKDFPQDLSEGVYVGYNLRFHPVLRRMRELLAAEELVSLQAYVGKFLPEWRPGVDYRSNYSARGDAGGGVLRDLSHELDYLNWILGRWSRMTALGGRYSDLEIESDDIFTVMMVMDKCPIVTVQMNYLDRIGHREILINTRRQTIKADLQSGVLVTGEREEKFSTERDLTYRLEHRSILDGRVHEACSASEGMEVVRMVEAAERAVKEGIWVER